MAAAVAEWEAAATKVPKSTRVVIIRTGIVLARDGGVLARMLPIFELFAGRCIRQPAKPVMSKELPMQLCSNQQTSKRTTHLRTAATHHNASTQRSKTFPTVGPKCLINTHRAG